MKNKVMFWLISFLCCICCICCSNVTASEPGDTSIKGIKNFRMKASLYCQVVNSTESEAIEEDFTLLHLDQNNVEEVSSPASNPSLGPMTKVYEDEKVLTIQNVAGATGSVDSIILNKETGVFVRVAAGMGVFEYAIAKKGYCK